MRPIRMLVLTSSALISYGAQAADLPARETAPVEYVRVCTPYGQGFFYIPGTDTCLRVGGRARGEYRYVEPNNRQQDAIGFLALGRINLDARTATAYGMLRTYIRMEMSRSTGVYGFSSSADISQAFIQFGGLTAGRTVSFFADANLPNPNWGDLRFNDPGNADLNLLAYTFSFGGGFSATLSLEDGTQTRVNNALNFPLFGAGSSSPVLAPLPFTYGGERIPDVVGNIRYTGTWGGVQLAGAVHQIRSAATSFGTGDGVIPPVLNPITGLPYPAFSDTVYGFAVAATGYSKVPALGPDDTVWFSATYTDGAVGYVNAGQTDPVNDGFISAGLLSLPFTDAFVDPFTGDLKTNRAYSIAGGLNHHWTPTLQTNLFGSWMRFDAPGIARYAVPETATTVSNGSANTVTGLVDFDEYRLGTNTIWTPVNELQIGVEVFYIGVNSRQRVAVPLTTASGNTTGSFRSIGQDHTWEGRIRVQRDF